MSPSLPSRTPFGYTLIELLVVIAVTGVLVALAMPNFTTLRLSSTRSAGTMELMSALSQARSEAIARNAPVSVCRRASSTGTPSCGSSSTGAWALGWVVYTGSSPESGATLGVYGPMGAVTGTCPKDFRIYVSGNNAAMVQFQANGRLTQAVDFTVCQRTAKLKDGRRISVGLGGSIGQQTLTAAATTAACQPDPSCT